MPWSRQKIRHLVPLDDCIWRMSLRRTKSAQISHEMAQMEKLSSPSGKGQKEENKTEKNEPTHEILALFVLRKLILQTRMPSYPVGLDVFFLVWPFVYFHTSCVRTAKALARLRGCAGSPEPSLVAYAISTIISWTGSNNNFVSLGMSRNIVSSNNVVISTNP